MESRGAGSLYNAQKNNSVGMGFLLSASVVAMTYDNGRHSLFASGVPTPNLLATDLSRRTQVEFVPNQKERSIILSTPLVYRFGTEKASHSTRFSAKFLLETPNLGYTKT